MMRLAVPASAPADEEAGDDLRRAALRAARGDDVALADLVRATSRTVWLACAALVDPDTADDLTQETYLRAVRSLPTFRGESSPARWLLTIARRVCADEIAGRQRARRLVDALEARRRAEPSDPSSVSDLRDAIDRLPDERREAFLLTAVAGLPYADAAAICGCPVGTIRSRVARARAELVETVGDMESACTIERVAG